MDVKKFMENTGFSGTFSHLALVVKDIKRTMGSYEQLLQVEEPRCKLTGEPESAHVVFMGKETPARAYQAFFDLRGLRVELLQPDEHPSTWREVLESQGEGLHHVAYDVEDMDEVIAFLEKLGLPVVQTGCYNGGKYAYIDSRKKIGMMLELLQSL